QLEAQMDQQTRLALNNPNFIKVNKAERTVALSQIFEWYASDFGGNKKASLAYINKYRNEAIPDDYAIKFYTYDWGLNKTIAAAVSEDANSFPEGLGNNASRYVVSSTVPKGTFELRAFNNLYTQKTGNEGILTDRSTFFTTLTSVIYGVTDRFNAGIDIRWRQVRNNSVDDSPLSVFTLESTPSTRQGITTIGPKIRWAPFENMPNFSIQSAFWFNTSDDLAGNGNDLPFIDFNGPTWWTQFFNDIPLGDNWSIFTEIDAMWEDIGSTDEGHFNRFSTPAILIVSYFPNPKTTIYGLSGFTPYWQADFDYFYQFGLGAKYQFTPDFELELLYTDFANEFLVETGGQASTYNFGIRYNIN
ncbi:MAG: hypothetical protein AAFO07_13565, partial [Bacteroidota bacterium]